MNEDIQWHWTFISQCIDSEEDAVSFWKNSVLMEYHKGVFTYSYLDGSTQTRDEDVNAHNNTFYKLAQYRGHFLDLDCVGKGV